MSSSEDISAKDAPESKPDEDSAFADWLVSEFSCACNNEPKIERDNFTV